MSEKEQIQAFEAELRSVIKRFRAEYDLSFASALGTIECVKLELWLEQKESLE